MSGGERTEMSKGKIWGEEVTVRGDGDNGEQEDV